MIRNDQEWSEVIRNNHHQHHHLHQHHYHHQHQQHYHHLKHQQPHHSPLHHQPHKYHQPYQNHYHRGKCSMHFCARAKNVLKMKCSEFSMHSFKSYFSPRLFLTFDVLKKYLATRVSKCSIQFFAR